MSKKFILSVQGEGRGHMTQAISMYDLLISNGHEVSAVIIGTSGRREIPKFFFEKINTKIIQLPSPNFVTDSKNKSVNIPRSVIENFKNLKTFRNSLNEIDKLIKEHEPDIVVNFFDLLMGLYYRFNKPKAKMVCIAHQYIYFHQDFEFPKGKITDRFAIKFFTKLTAHRSVKNLALSFYNIHTKNKNVTVVPPLLREDIFSLKPKNEGFLLVYLVNNGYFEEVLEWHYHHPDIEIHCFTDQAEQLSESFFFNKEKLVLHALNDKLFLEMMSDAAGMASTAGFESVCEAMFLGKPVLMVPIKGHFEQFCNSRDAYKAGAGIYDDKFDLGKLLSFSSTFNPENVTFKSWVINAKHRIYNEIISV